MNNIRLRVHSFCDINYPMNLTNLARVGWFFLRYFIYMIFILSISVFLAFINCGLLRKNWRGL